ncbi:GNAT family N-acetyltransferase [Rhizobium sp. R86522]|uniref:GNAT family N-acetyltransferase n=1 Tax=Rhizobium sp. R86522 TaxID=3093861 RepID=UPI00366ED004
MGLRQVAPQDDVGWKAYHAIRQFVLYELRGRHDYDASHPDDYKVGNVPFLYDVDNLPIGAVRLDFSTADPAIATVRMVAILPQHQRRGFGTAMLQALELFAADKGVRELKVLAASDAATFYERCGWKPGKTVGSGLRLTKSIAAP